jgi:hypothetical protein
MEIVLSTMSDSHSDLATAITAAITMPQRMLLSLSVVAAAVKSHALAPDASTGCIFAALSPCSRFQKSGLIGGAGQPVAIARLCACLCGIRMSGPGN